MSTFIGYKLMLRDPRGIEYSYTLTDPVGVAYTPPPDKKIYRLLAWNGHAEGESTQYVHDTPRYYFSVFKVVGLLKVRVPDPRTPGQQFHLEQPVVQFLGIDSKSTNDPDDDVPFSGTLETVDEFVGHFTLPPTQFPYLTESSALVRSAYVGRYNEQKIFNSDVLWPLVTGRLLSPATNLQPFAAVRLPSGNIGYVLRRA